MLTGLVAMGKGAEVVWPAGTRTWPGGETVDDWRLVKVTSAPPEGAGPSSLTTAIVMLPPVTGLGLNVRLIGLGRIPVPVNTIVGTFVTWLTAPVERL